MEWKTVKLGEVLTIKYGKDYKGLPSGNVPVYGSGGIMNYVNKSLYSQPSVLIPRLGTLNNICYVDKPFSNARRRMDASLTFEGIATP